MNETSLLALGVLCGLNVGALLTVLFAGRRHRPVDPDLQARFAPPRELADDRPARPLHRSAQPAVEDLVAEAEEAERLAARGESRLAADLARWRKHSADGKTQPAAAAFGRSAAAGRAR